MPPATAANAGLDDPSLWLGSSPLLDLEDPRLRLRAQALAQLCKTPREKALAVYGFVKRIPFAKSFKMRLHTAREVLDNRRGDAPDKATVLVALLRLVDIPARIRYVELRGELLRGLTSSMVSAGRPVVEAWLQGRWVQTDTYIFDAGYMAAARERLRDNGWDWGYGIGREGHSIWNGVDGAWLAGRPPADDPMMVADHGVYCDPLEYVSSEIYQNVHPRLPRALHWNMLAPLMERSIRDLRKERKHQAQGVGKKA